MDFSKAVKNISGKRKGILRADIGTTYSKPVWSHKSEELKKEWESL